jgi:fucose 4-O-acetylase-like acetyltransferase
MISGFFLNTSYKKNNFIADKAKRLLIPYLIYGIIFSLILPIKDFTTTFNFQEYLLSILKNIQGLLYGNGNHWPIWFLSALFVSQIFLYAMLDILKISKYLLFICLLISILLLQIIPQKIILPCEIDLIPMISLFILIGNFIFTTINKMVLKYSKLIIFSVGLCLIIIGTIAANNNIRVDINSRGYGFFYLFIIASISISIGFMLISSLIKKMSVLSLFGKASLTILGIHIIIGILLNLLFQKIFQDIPSSGIGIFACMILTTLIQTLFCLPFYFLFNKLKLSYLT